MTVGVGTSFRNTNVRTGDPLGMSNKIVLLAADNTEVDTRQVSMIDLRSDNTTAANRTFTLTASNLVGHELLILFTSGSSYTAQLANSGTCRLQNGAWEPSQYSSIKLVSDGTYWYEQGRGNGVWQTTTSVTLSSDNQAVATAATGTLLITSDNATATSRTFTLTADSVAGHVLSVVFISASNKCELAADSTTILTRSWLPSQYDVLTLVSDGTRWIEIARTEGAQSTQVTTASITGDSGTAIVTLGRRYIAVSSDNATATSRTFSLAISNIVGQRLTLLWSHATNKGELLVDSTTLLSGTWYPDENDTLDLISTGVLWVEVARSNGNAGSQVKTVALTGDNTAIPMKGFRYINVGSDSATATSRTFTLTVSNVVGQRVTLCWNDATNRGECVADSTTKLTEDWRPNIYDTLEVVSDGTRWIEVGRAYGNTATKVQSVALTADDQAVPTIGAELIILTSDNATAANRTFVPTASPIVGHRLTLLWASTNEGQLADTGAVKLVSAAWEPTNLYQTIQLISDGTNWIELGRADPT